MWCPCRKPITADPADAAAMNRSTPLWKEMLGSESNLRAEAAEQGVYGSVLTGDIEVLVPYSNDANNIQGIFTIGFFYRRAECVS